MSCNLTPPHAPWWRQRRGCTQLAMIFGRSTDTQEAHPLLEQGATGPHARRTAARSNAHWPSADTQPLPLLAMGDEHGEHDHAEEEGLLTPRDPRCARCSVTSSVGLSVALAYSLSYFWRYPIFILPEAVLSQHVMQLGGRPLDLQACFSMAFVGGFGAAKLPMASYVSSARFFRHKLASLGGMLVSSMVVECGGVWLFAHRPGLQVACVFVSSFLASGIFGGFFGAYLEGRRSTETLLAVCSAALIYAGNLARACAAWVLSQGVSPHAMPLAIGVVACPLSLLLLYNAHLSPGPSTADEASRSKRSPMTSSCGLSATSAARPRAPAPHW